MKKLSKPMIAAIVLGKIVQHGCILCLLCGVSAVVLAGELHAYMDDVPRITTCEFSVPTDTTISCEDFAYFENAAYYQISDAHWQDGSTDGVQISQDGQSLEISEQTGTLTVHVYAVGSNAEHADADAVINVRGLS